ncbi:DUF3253 domain-containing protein [Hyphomonas johnsonii]|uniref:DUF3253 domain-containing protein n=1 Tax=Hyphomonas johnsonii MHS-2 TaxID=1280950 RepID=A0A059F962_9PROT|nr:DUF3253 domain-containing protein [Hyphomonas johnsonii]KCZ87140.1 hypothetical protein HJO_17239 [Hyphomonas johnsonii MHS-2]
MSEPGHNAVREAILALTAECGVGKTISAEQAARAVSEENFQRVLKDVRAEAVRLAKAGTISIYRKGKPVENLDTFKGVYRLGLPQG